MNHIIIGCGGVGSWVLPKLIRIVKNIDGGRITLVDGDALERKNLDRQLFESDDIGKNKAEALAARHRGAPVAAIPSWFSLGSMDGIRRGDILFCCVDNHAARRAALETADMIGCVVIIAANEYTDAEAYIYRREWKGTPLDPRVFYPIIQTDNSENPLAPEGCTGDAQEATPQLVLANDWASGLMLHLYWYHTVERVENDYPMEFWPVHHRGTFAKFTTLRHGDKIPAIPAALAA